MLLNLGCGDDIRQGYDNIDIRDLPGVIQADVRNLPYKPESIDEIRAADIYEHIPFAESQQLLNHWVSLLKPKGKLIIQGPSIENLARRILISTDIRDVEQAIELMFGTQDYKENHHYTAIHPELITHYLRKAGITGEINVETKGMNLIIKAWK